MPRHRHTPGSFIIAAVMKKETRVNHPPRAELPEGNTPVIDPVYRSVKYTYPTIAEGRTLSGRGGFYYTRGGNPTTRQLETLAAELQGTEDAIAVASGMAAISNCLLANLASGDNLVFFTESYKPSRSLIRDILPRFGITHAMLSVSDHAAIEQTFARPETRMVFFESPTNPMLRVADLEFLLGLAEKHQVTTVLDNTFAGFHNHGDYPVDLYIHSLTKFASGHGDVMGGLIAGNQDRIRRIRHFAVDFGAVLDPAAAYEILRGMRTYFVRYRHQCDSAMALARHLQSHPGVSRVFYPGLPDDPGHDLARRQMQDFGAVVSFEVDANRDQTWAFIDALQLFVTCASLGSSESLVAPARLYWGTDLDATELEQSLIRDSTVRIAVGLEHVDDLKHDLDQALGKALGMAQNRA